MISHDRGYIPSFAQGWAEGGASDMPEIWDAEPMFILAPILGCQGKTPLDLMGKCNITKEGTGAPTWTDNGMAGINGVNTRWNLGRTYDASRPHTILGHFTTYLAAATNRTILSLGINPTGTAWFGVNSPIALLYTGTWSVNLRYGSVSVACRWNGTAANMIGYTAGKFFRITGTIATPATSTIYLFGGTSDDYTHFVAAAGRLHSVMAFDRYLSDDLCRRFIADPVAYLRPRSAVPAPRGGPAFRAAWARRNAQLISGGV